MRFDILRTILALEYGANTKKKIALMNKLKAKFRKGAKINGR